MTNVATCFYLSFNLTGKGRRFFWNNQIFLIIGVLIFKPIVNAFR